MMILHMFVISWRYTPCHEFSWGGMMIISTVCVCMIIYSYIIIFIYIGRRKIFISVASVITKQVQGVYIYIFGWWFGTFYFSIQLGISSSQLTHIFQRGRSTTNQI